MSQDSIGRPGPHMQQTASHKQSTDSRELPLARGRAKDVALSTYLFRQEPLDRNGRLQAVLRGRRGYGLSPRVSKASAIRKVLVLLSIVHTCLQGLHDAAPVVVALHTWRCICGTTTIGTGVLQSHVLVAEQVCSGPTTCKAAAACPTSCLMDQTLPLLYKWRCMIPHQGNPTVGPGRISSND